MAPVRSKEAVQGRARRPATPPQGAPPDGGAPPSARRMPRCIAALSPGAADGAGADALFRQVAACGFDGVLVPLSDGEAGAARAKALAQFGTVAGAAVRHGLALLPSIRMERFAGDDEIVQQRPEWFRALRGEDAQLPDPRRPFPPPRHAVARVEDDDCVAGLAVWWSERLQALFDRGAAGICLEAPAALGPPMLRRLVETLRANGAGAHVLAWTPGLPAGEIDALVGSGLDAVFSSLPWWDFRSSWLYEEQVRLDRVARVYAPVAQPALAGVPAVTAWDPAARRRLAYAAASADGVLVPVDAQLLLDRDTGPALVDELRPQLSRVAARRPGQHRLVRPLLRGDSPALAVLVDPADSDSPAQLLLLNTDDTHVVPVDSAGVLRAAGAGAFDALLPDQGDALEPGSCVALEPGEVRVYQARASRPVQLARVRGGAREAAQAPRVAIERVRPLVDGGRYVVKRVVGETVVVEADIFTDGHEHLSASVAWRAADARNWQQAPMRKLGNDRWRAEFPLQRVGRHEFVVEAWRDRFGSMHAELEAKRGAGNLSALDVGEAVALVEAAAARSKANVATRLRGLRKRLQEAADDSARADLLLEPDTSTLMARADDRPFLSRSQVCLVDAERRAAAFASWYELFPRSMSGDPDRHGRFDDVVAQLPRIRDMGFDVLYMPPIHPIGTTHRKGRNNSLVAQPGEPGSPYAIGSQDGGHDAVHPELGTLEDFRRLVAAAADHGLEVALDFAIQCSPDHPWLREHPDWFAWRADGTVRYAENPPKKYQDIVNVDFYADGAVPGLWQALRDVILFWISQGVLLFRVDNPHTKPYAFWEWMIDEVRARHPEAVFLSEAFTRPRPMYLLAKLGFSQSYTYFTWRHGKQEFVDFMQELADGEPRDFYRPHLFVNTPDINPQFLQKSGRPGHLIRAALATTLSGLWGMYSGFELCEATPLAQGKEEYLDSEKFQLRAWDWQRPGNIVAEISRLNLLRRLHPALQSHLGVRFHNALNDQVLYFGKRAPGERSIVLVAICLDPFHPQSATIEVPLWELGLPDHAAVDVEDLWHGRRFRWHGKQQHVHLDPHALPFAIWRIEPAGEDA